jgi:steroid delta-isomerase-like uncharacterized protein
MSEEHRALARRVVEEIYNSGDLDVADEIYAPDCILHDPSLPENLRGPEGIKHYAGMYRNAFPDLRVTIEEEICEGDRMAMRWTARGTHTGDLMGIPPTGKPMVVSGVTLGRSAGGRIVEEWFQSDDLGMMQQLGLVPAMQGAAS